MLQLSADLVSKNVVSLRTGGIVARVAGAIFNPDNLKIEGFYCNDNASRQELILLHQDIREVLRQGYVVNDHEVLVEASELVRLKNIIELDFEIIGKQVITVDKQKVGKVSDYATETESMFVQKIYVHQSIFKSLSAGSLSIDRNQIVEITPKQIIINEIAKTVRMAASATA